LWQLVWVASVDSPRFVTGSSSPAWLVSDASEVGPCLCRFPLSHVAGFPFYASHVLKRQRRMEQARSSSYCRHGATLRTMIADHHL
jgi:hypothetical protein